MTRALATGIGIVALAATAGCGGGGGGGDKKGGGSASDLPSATTVAAAAKYVGQYTTCGNTQSGTAYDNNTESNQSWGAGGEAEDPSWGIKERAVCEDKSGTPITLLLTPDMKKFQTALKKHHKQMLVGADFAVVLMDADAIQGMRKSKLKFLSCEPNFSVPGGYTKEPALVDGCVLTNYVPS
ncbi:hypothetical protein ACWCV9_19620 [Streptomyces sp. NPDC001606]